MYQNSSVFVTPRITQPKHFARFVLVSCHGRPLFLLEQTRSPPWLPILVSSPLTQKSDVFCPQHCPFSLLGYWHFLKEVIFNTKKRIFPFFPFFSFFFNIPVLFFWASLPKKKFNIQLISALEVSPQVVKYSNKLNYGIRILWNKVAGKQNKSHCCHPYLSWVSSLSYIFLIFSEDRR